MYSDLSHKEFKRISFITFVHIFLNVKNARYKFHTDKNIPWFIVTGLLKPQKEENKILSITTLHLKK